MRILACILLAGLLAAADFADAQPRSHLTHAQALNKAARQRMLSQRIVKAYVQVAEGISAGTARGQLADAVWVFDDQLADLKAFAPTPELRKSVDDVAQQWNGFRALATGPVSREGASALRAAGERLLQAAEQNAQALEQLGAGQGGRLVNLAGRQRMLSQRIAKSYLLLTWGGFDVAAVRTELALAREEFTQALSALRAAAENTDDIRNELAAVAELWQKLQPMLERERESPAGRAAVVDAADAILNRMERVTSLYEKLAPG